MIARIIAPIVRGQIRSFMLAHPGQLRSDLAPSIAKRIINDLTCDDTVARLRSALLLIDGAPMEAGMAAKPHEGDCARAGSDGAFLIKSVGSANDMRPLSAASVLRVAKSRA